MRGAARALAVALLALAACHLARPARAQNHSELDWLTFETDHFIVHYHDGVDETARQAAIIAETIYPRITGLYDWEPAKKTHLILGDYEDYANGSAYFFDGKMAIWATNLEFDLRGTTQWLWNVITHEFTHMVNIQASQRTPTNVPAVYLQWFDYEDERRTDVLTGYPNRIASYPYSGVQVPAWFAEGSAQYMTSDTHLDQWDAHRDMIVRVAALDGTLLTYDEMSLFKGTLCSEMVYDHGFSMTRYIAREYGEASLREIIEGLRSPFRLTPEGAFEKATGKSGAELYREWRAEVEATAEAQAARVRPTERSGTPFEGDQAGTYNIHPLFSPDGRRLAWISNGGSPFHRGSLVVRDVAPADGEDAPTELLAPGVAGGFDWAPDGKSVYYAKRAEKDRFGSLYFDLYRYDLESEEETRLTRGARLRDPAVSPDGTKIAAVYNADGTNDVVLVDLPAEEENANVTVITDSPFGRQYYAPKWSVDGLSLIVDAFDSGGSVRQGETRDIVRLEAFAPVPVEPEPLFASPADDRMPFVHPSDAAILFTSDTPASGFSKFDVYRLDFETMRTTRLTNVVGGALYPALSPDGRLLAFASFTSDGYKIHVMPIDDALNEPIERFEPLERDVARITPVTIDVDPHPYRGQFSRFLVSPRVVVDEGRVKLGLYASTNDVLDKQSIFGGLAAGTNGDFDLFAIYENRLFWPTLFAEGFWIRKHREDAIDAKLEGLERRWDLDLRYDALEVDVGLRLENGSLYSPYFYSELSARFRYSKSHLNLAVTKLTPVDDLLDDGQFLILPKDGWDYYRGRDVVVSWTRRQAARRLDAEINPVGSSYALQYVFSNNDLSPSGNREVDDAGIVTTLYDDNTFHQISGVMQQSRGLPYGSHAFEARLQGGWISERVDDFFWFRVGSRPGLRGYTYYTLEGRAYGLGRATYRFPVLPKIDRRLLQFHLERLYAGVFYEAGLVWERPIWDDIKRQKLARDLVRDVGFELRLDMVNFNTFPARLYVEGAYSLDRVPIPNTITDESGDAGGELTTKDWKFYFGFLFGY